MAETGSGRIWWIAILIVILLTSATLFWPSPDNDETSMQPATKSELEDDPMVDSIKVVSWDWRDDKTGSLYAVWGIIKNESAQELAKVVLQLRTIDVDSNTIARYTIKTNGLAPQSTKPFREDVPRTGREHKGFLTVLRVAP